MNGHQALRRRQRVASDRTASLDRLSEPPTQPQLATVLDTDRTVCGSSSVYEIAGVYLSLSLPVCLSVCLSHLAPQPRRHACGGFAAVAPRAGDIDRLLQDTYALYSSSRRGRLSIYLHSSTAVSSKCDQCHGYSDV